MFKSFYYMINFTPIILNMLIFFIFIMPYKNNKFNPFNLMFMLILTTILISIKMNMYLNSWSSFILFLIMIGGLMIIFMYIISLMNNELFKMNYKNIILNIIKIFMINMIFFLLYKNYIIQSNNYFMWFNKNLILNFHEIYMNYYNNSTMFIIIYLFYSMICIMNICYKFKAPLRQLFF